MRHLILAVAILALIVSSAHAAICVQTGSITLTWQANPEPDIRYYEIYRSDTVDGTYTWMVDDFLMETAFLTNLPEGDHYFKLKAVDTCGNKSGFSDPSEVVRIDTTPPGKPATITITVVAE